MRFAQRRSQIDSSGIRRIFDLAATLKDPCNLSIGMPDFDVPDEIKESAIAAIRSGRNGYTQTAGVPALRKKILEMYARRQQPADDVIITAGTSGGLFLCFLALLDPGDGIMFADPYFVMYKHLSRFIGAEPIPVDTYPTFRMTRAALEAAWTPRCRMLIVNSPNNPTGMVYSPEEIAEIAAFAREKDLIVISDEIYESFSFDGDSPSIAPLIPGCITISGLSKSVAVTGWRIGWVAGPADLIKALSEIQQYSFVCATSIAQEAALVALDHDMTPTRIEYTRRRDFIYNGLRDAGYEVEKPGGAFYIFPKSPWGTGDDFVRAGIDRGLLTVPGSVFSERASHFRISFAASMRQLERGVGILRDLVRKP